MSNNSPIFPMPDSHHFSDYGFDPQNDYFQVLEEATKHRKETTRSIESHLFKHENPILKDHHDSSKNNKKKWWRKVALFFNRKWSQFDRCEDVHHARAQAFRASHSGPVCSTAPNHYNSRTLSGPLAGVMTPTRKDEILRPYLSLRELTLEQKQRPKYLINL